MFCGCECVLFGFFFSVAGIHFDCTLIVKFATQLFTVVFVHRVPYVVVPVCLFIYRFIILIRERRMRDYDLVRV